MDRGDTLVEIGAPGVGAVEALLACDQAVFTSIRTPTGEGYRVIAASVAVGGDERAEITRRAPAHGSLCDVETAAVGLDSYRLERGRRCVAYTTYAGTEHTARGGGRVYTHFALLQEADFRKLDANPLRAHRVLGEIFHTHGPILKPPPQLDPLHIPIADSVPLLPEPIEHSPLAAPVSDWLWPAVAELLKGGRVVLVGSNLSLELARWILLCLPLAMRETLDVTFGLKPSATRASHLFIAQTLDLRSRQFLQGQGLSIWDTAHAPPLDDEPLPPWLDLLRTWWDAGSWAEITDFFANARDQASP